jgi:CTP:molybdopterin cytidylyltransferase MocA
MSERIGCLVLAAGAASRFGGRKQLAPLAGRPLLEHALASAAAASVDRVHVVLGANADAILATIDRHGVVPLVCADWELGMSAPLRAGIAAVADCEAAVVLLGDQPLVTAAAIDRVLAARNPGNDAIRATYSGNPGHPVVLEHRLFDAVAELEGDAGARGLLGGTRVLEVPCDDVADPLDVDHPADLRAAEQALAS